MSPVKTIDRKRNMSAATMKSKEVSSGRRGKYLSRGMALANTKIAWKHPVNLVHAVTARCNAQCGFCAWKFHDGSNDELSTKEIMSLYDDARKAGFHWMTLWGGEPLIRRDIGEVARHADELGFSASLVTNGFLLTKKLDEVAPFVDRIIISVDHPSERHDEIRGLPGLFERIVDSTNEIKQKYPGIPIVYTYTMQRDNCDQKSIKEMAVFVDRMGVTCIFNPLRVEAASKAQKDMKLEEFNASGEQIGEAFSLIGRLKSTGYKIINSYTYIDILKTGLPVYRCHWPKINLPIEANGDVVDCMQWGKNPIANIRNEKFDDILKSPRLRALAGHKGESCHKCISHHRMEISEIYEGNPEPLLSWAGALSHQIIKPGVRKQHNIHGLTHI